MDKNSLNSLTVACFDNVTKQNEKKKMVKVHLGVGVKDKHLKNVSDSLVQYVDKDEKIIALFIANRVRPMTNWLVLTNYRMLTLKDTQRRYMKLVNEIAADDILKFTTKKGLGKRIKLFVTKKDAKKVYVAVIGENELTDINSFLSKMSGTPRPMKKEALFRKDDKYVPTSSIIYLVIGSIIMLIFFPPILIPFLVGGIGYIAFDIFSRKWKKKRQSLSIKHMNVADEIAQYGDLKKRGLLTDKEFEAKKKQLLGL